MAAPIEIHVRADDDGAGGGSVIECREDDNSCVILDGDVGGLALETPTDVGPALRANDHGDPHAPDIRATFDWSLDAGAPRDLGTGPAQEHYHFLRGVLGNGPPLLALIPGFEPLLDLSFQDSTLRAPAAELPRVHG